MRPEQSTRWSNYCTAMPSCERISLPLSPTPPTPTHRFNSFIIADTASCPQIPQPETTEDGALPKP